MDKKIINTILITLVAIVCVIAFTWGALSILFPYKVGKFAQKIGADNVAFYYFETDYKRNKSDDRLFNLSASAYCAKKYSKTQQYGEELLKRDTFINSYTNEKYLDTCFFVLMSKYYMGQELMEFLVGHTFHYSGEKIVDFKEYSVLLESVMFLASSKGDKEFLQVLERTLNVEIGITQDYFYDNILNANDNITSDYEQYVILLYNLETLINN